MIGGGRFEVTGGVAYGGGGGGDGGGGLTVIGDGPVF